jgi:putative Holliday junction resolvase
LSGEIGISAKKTLEFVDHLKNNFKVPITTWDERLTTVLASRALSETGMSVKKQRSIIDKSAATFILQSYLESKRK